MSLAVDDNYTIHQSLYKAAVDLAEQRYPDGWAGAAALRTNSGKILTSISPAIKQEGLGLCMEVGAICEAHKLNEEVTHSLCVSRSDNQTSFVILSPCGICQERLFHWGYDVQVAVTNAENQLIFKPLKALMPHHWYQAFE
ncbi:cytidine deaminase [Zooshikella marina]|uniref:cytidine deaminase n=1 Tax=Zooshikella ganghwensis TaxID=202772 RepID=UPI001BB0C3C1|nr:cytidine deaminase [Zooshikella ganghwensis]MBU2706882.1 cytidine deaminase [Zooshikella ganghwensis]